MPFSKLIPMEAGNGALQAGLAGSFDEMMETLPR
jgi:hypothetical protein